MARFDYEALVQKSLRGVVKESLKEVLEHGFIGNHHFYITFETNRPDVEMPDSLREKHPEEITIVLQHQFWDLVVTDEFFSITLSFNDRHENVKVPYCAIVSFLDPSVKFGLQFVPDECSDAEDSPSDRNEDSKTTEEAIKSKGNNIVTLDKFRKK